MLTRHDLPQTFARFVSAVVADGVLDTLDVVALLVGGAAETEVIDYALQCLHADRHCRASDARRKASSSEIIALADKRYAEIRDEEAAQAAFERDADLAARMVRKVGRA